MIRDFRSFAVALCFVLVLAALPAVAQSKSYIVSSPNGAVTVKVDVGSKLSWSVAKGGEAVIEPSTISLQLGDGSILGDSAKVTADKTEKIDTSFKAINYVKALVHDRCNQLTLTFANGFELVVRAYDDAAAYRFITTKPGEIIVKNEEANFNFSADYPAFIPYLWDFRDGQAFNASFESLYTESKLSEFKADSYAFLPLLVSLKKGRKVEILEADLESYPGMFLVLNETGKGLKALHVQYPLETRYGGYHGFNLIPTKRADYIAKSTGTRSFPWRVAVITDNDKELLSNDIVQRLASAPRLDDTSWVIPGQVSWDWWNDWNITHVDFKAGINTATYKYYIDFAAANHAKYIIMDLGWSDPLDLNTIEPAIDLKQIVDYGKSKNVGVILWAPWSTVARQMQDVFPKYSAMGVKGFKIDFFDRNDQVAVESAYNIAKLAAQYKLMVDYHGIYAPTGLQRTWPNVIGNEGVYGLENYKWDTEGKDIPRYAVTLPFIRNVAGPMDYTPGAMRNATETDFHPSNHEPMAKGTRCNQIAMYVVFEVADEMLSDSPSIYMKEQESTDFITAIPTVFDETVPLGGQVAEYVATARRNGDKWYVGAMTNWTPRDLTLDFSFLKPGSYQAVIMQDGVNADHEATDYKKVTLTIQAGQKLNVHLAKGGGWLAILTKK